MIRTPGAVGSGRVFCIGRGVDGYGSPRYGDSLNSAITAWRLHLR